MIYLARMNHGFCFGRLGIWWDGRFRFGRRMPPAWRYGICLGWLHIVWRSKQCQAGLLKIRREIKAAKIGGAK